MYERDFYKMIYHQKETSARQFEHENGYDLEALPALGGGNVSSHYLYLSDDLPLVKVVRKSHYFVANSLDTSSDVASFDPLEILRRGVACLCFSTQVPVQGFGSFSFVLPCCLLCF